MHEGWDDDDDVMVKYVLCSILPVFFLLDTRPSSPTPSKGRYKPRNPRVDETVNLDSAFEEEVRDVITPRKRCVSTRFSLNPTLNVNVVRSTTTNPFIDDDTVYLEDISTR